jgi:16S rRNA (guanine527-N7)-methyltransferase
MTKLEFITYTSNNGLILSNEQISQLQKYQQMLKEKNQVMNLTSIVEEEEVFEKHFLDSLLFSFNENLDNKECIDYFVRRYTLYHVNGIALLVVSVVNVVMGVGYVSMDYDYVCNGTITKVVKYVMWYEVGLGTFVVGVFGVAVVVKVFNFIVAYTCPKVNVCLSKWGSDQKRIKNKINFQLNKKV